MLSHSFIVVLNRVKEGKIGHLGSVFFFQVHLTHGLALEHCGLVLEAFAPRLRISKIRERSGGFSRSCCLQNNQMIFFSSRLCCQLVSKWVLSAFEILVLSFYMIYNFICSTSEEEYV